MEFHCVKLTNTQMFSRWKMTSSGNYRHFMFGLVLVREFLNLRRLHVMICAFIQTLHSTTQTVSEVELL